MEHGVTVVSPDWILDCDSNGTRLSESSYHPSLLEYEEETAAAAASNDKPNGPSSVRECEDKDNFPVGENEVTESLQNKAEEKFPSTSTEETIMESNNHLELKPQAWNEDSTSSILEGIIFHIIDYPVCVGEETIEKWKKVDIFK